MTASTCTSTSNSGPVARPRLSDPAGYSVRRDVADLEEIRQRIGARKVILIGHSYGAQIAATYLADHPNRVSRAVFSSPGSIDPARPGGDLTARLDTGQKLATYALTLRPRVLLAYGLVQIAPASAHRFVGDAEMDARFDRLYHATKPALHCRDHPPGPDLYALGAYANAYPQSASAPRPSDPRRALRSVDTAALVVKAACDYEPWSAGQDLLGVMRNARFGLPRARRTQRLAGASALLPGSGALLSDRPSAARSDPSGRRFEGPA